MQQTFSSANTSLHSDRSVYRQLCLLCTQAAQSEGMQLSCLGVLYYVLTFRVASNPTDQPTNKTTIVINLASKMAPPLHGSSYSETNMKNMRLNVDCMEAIWKACLTVAEPRVIQLHLDYEQLGYVDEFGVKVPNNLIDNPDPNADNDWEYNPHIGYEWGWSRNPDWETAVIKTLAPAPALLHVCRRSREIAFEKYNLRLDALRKECYIYIDPSVDTLYIRQNVVGEMDQQHLFHGTAFKQEVRDKIQLIATDASGVNDSSRMPDDSYSKDIQPADFKSLVKITLTNHFSQSGCFHRDQKLFKEHLTILESEDEDEELSGSIMKNHILPVKAWVWPNWAIKYKHGHLLRDGTTCCMAYSSYFDQYAGEHGVRDMHNKELQEWENGFREKFNPFRNRDIAFWEEVEWRMAEPLEQYNILKRDSPAPKTTKERLHRADFADYAAAVTHSRPRRRGVKYAAAYRPRPSHKFLISVYPRPGFPPITKAPRPRPRI